MDHIACGWNRKHVLLQVFAQHSDDPLSAQHSRPLCLVVVQLLALHEVLHQKAAMQSLLVVILACLDSKHWLQEVSQEAQTIAAVLEVLHNDYGFNDELAEEEAEQGQEAAWAVLAAVSKYMAENDVSDQVCPASLMDFRAWITKAHQTL